jgi:hypothetical protein
MRGERTGKKTPRPTKISKILQLFRRRGVSLGAVSRQTRCFASVLSRRARCLAGAFSRRARCLARRSVSLRPISRARTSRRLPSVPISARSAPLLNKPIHFTQHLRQEWEHRGSRVSVHPRHLLGTFIGFLASFLELWLKFGTGTGSARGAALHHRHEFVGEAAHAGCAAGPGQVPRMGTPPHWRCSCAGDLPRWERGRC